MTETQVAESGSIFTDPSAYADPTGWHLAAQSIRERSPILPTSIPGFPRFVAVTKHVDVMEVERNPEVFTNAPMPVIGPTETHGGVRPGGEMVKTLIQMDGIEHKVHRGIVSGWFKPGNVKKMQARIDELATRYVDRMAELGGSCDFVNDVALHYPLQVIMSILGLPEEDYPRMLKLTQELFGAEDPDIARISEQPGLVDVIMDFLGYFTDLVASRRADPTDDLASVIANAQIDDEPLADMDMFGHYLIIATAGHDTTSNAISGGLLAFLEQPDQLELLRNEPDLIGNAADEIVRWVTPVKHFERTCREPYTVGGYTFEPGELALLSYASANRDIDVFVDPHRFDIRRENASDHLGFGFGRHFCLGAHLARLEIRAIFAELARRVDRIELAGEPTWIQSSFVQGPKSIPISYRMR